MKRDNLRTLVRHFRYGVHLLFERSKGLDFTMTSMTESINTEGRIHGYCKTDERHTRRVLDKIGVEKEDSVLDIGCGKGAFLKEACRYPFMRVAGIEYSEELSRIAERNFRKLGLSDRVKIFNCDAAAFEHYDDYNLFFMFNPFDGEIMDQVVSQIANNKRRCRIIYHHPTCPEILTKYGFSEEYSLMDNTTGYETVVFTKG